MQKNSADQNNSYARVDKIKKWIYNINGKILSLLLCAAVTCGLAVCTLSLPSSAAQRDDRISAFSFQAEQDAEGSITVTLSLNEGFAVCGFSAELKFDADKLILSGSEMPASLEENGFCLTVKGREGRSSVIFDGRENATCGTLAIFEFESMEAVDGGTLKLNLTVNEAYFWEKDHLSALPAFSFDIIVAPASEKCESAIPVLASATVLDRGGDRGLELVGIFPQDCIAAGFEVILVDLSNLDTQRLSVSRVLRLEADEKSADILIDIPDGGRICLVITPISYRARGACAGDESVMLIEDGAITD